MKLFNILAICSGMPSQSPTDTKIDYNGYKVMTVTWKDASISSDVENILQTNSIDIWSDPESIYENKSVKIMVSDEIGQGFKMLSR